MKLNEGELMNISGGGTMIWASIGAAIAFLISVVDGFYNPSRCSN